VQVDVLRQAGLQVDVVLPPNFESDVSLCIDGAATKPVKFVSLVEPFSREDTTFNECALLHRYPFSHPSVHLSVTFLDV